MPFCSVEETRKIEKVQYRALKYVYNDSNVPYRELLRERSQIPLLDVFIQRQNAILIELIHITLSPSICIV